MSFFRGSRSREERATKEDLMRIERSMRIQQLQQQRMLQQQQQQQGKMTGRQLAAKGVRMVGRGINDVAKSQSQMSSRGRPRISQLPATRRDIPIAKSMNLKKLKMRSMRDDTIMGRGNR